MTLTLSAGSTAVVVDELIDANLARAMNRTITTPLNQAAVTVNHGTPGKLSGTLVYLCRSLTDAAAAVQLYAGTTPVTLTAGGGQVTGLTHYAIGTARIAAERVLPGQLPRWTISVDIREA